MKGMWIAAVTTAVILLGFVEIGPPHDDPAMYVGALCVLVAPVVLPIGVGLGWFAGRLREHRVLTLEAVALSIVMLLAAIASDTPIAFLTTVALASPPTALAALALERWTRSPPPVPRALALASKPPAR